VRKNEAKRRLLANVSSNIAAMAITVLIGFWLTRYLIQQLKVAAYGMIPLVTQIVAYFDLFSKAIRDAVGRFVAIHFNRQENEQSNIYFNTALFFVLFLCLLLCIVVIAIAAILPWIFNVPQGHERGTRWLFVLVALSSFFAAVTSPFAVSTLVKHRFDLSNLVVILSKLLRVGIVILCFTFFGPSLKYVGWSYCGMGLFLLAGSMWLTRYLTPQLRVGWKSCRWNALRAMTAMGGWMTINQIGTLLYLSTDLIIINLLLGDVQGGRYGPFVLLVSLVSMIGTAIASVFTPIVYEFLAQKKNDALVQHTKRSIKFMGLITALPTGLLCGLSTPLLRCWLGASFADLSPLMWLLIGPWVVNVTVRPMFSIYRGMNKVKVPAIVILAGGVANVIMSVLLIKYTGLGLYGAALASVFCLTSKNLFFTPIYTAVQLGSAKFIFFRDMIPGVLMAALVSLVGLGLSRMYDLSSIPHLFAVTLMLSLVYVLVSYQIALNKEDRSFLLSLFSLR